MSGAIHFVTGKGGTGKSLIASALALGFSRSGRKTLLVELGDRSFYRDFFTLPRVGYEPSPLAADLDVALWNGPDTLRDYAGHLLKVDAVTKLFFDNPVSRSIIDIAPALHELSILGKVTSGTRKVGPDLPYETLVVDAYATGHFLNLFRAPKGMAGAVPIGPMGQQSRAIDEVLRNPKICVVHVVALAEEMPVQETVDLVRTLREEFSIEPKLILNRVVDVPVEAASSDHPFARYLEQTRRRQNEARERLQKTGSELRAAPLVFDEEPRVLQETVAEALS